jgi:hypothetical protein
MTSTAGALLQLGVSPKIGDLVAAAKELLEDARVLIDNGIAFSELDQVAVGAVAVEVICRGIAATLAVPYRQVLEACALSYIDGKPADREALRAILAQGKAEGRKIEADAAATASRKPVRAKKRSKAKPPEPVKAVTSGSICPICQGNVPCGEVGHPGVA